MNTNNNGNPKLLNYLFLVFPVILAFFFLTYKLILLESKLNRALNIQQQRPIYRKKLLPTRQPKSQPESFRHDSSEQASEKTYAKSTPPSTKSQFTAKIQPQTQSQSQSQVEPSTGILVHENQSATISQTPTLKDQFMNRARLALAWHRENHEGIVGINHDEIVKLLVSSYPSPEMPICVVQVGANRADELQHGYSIDDPIVAAILNNKTRGILIEPVLGNYQELLRNVAPYSNRFKCIHAAVAVMNNNNTVMPFYMVDEERVKAEFPSSPAWLLNQLGSFDKSHIIKHFVNVNHSWIPRISNYSYYIRTIYVNTFSTNQTLSLLTKFFPKCQNIIHFLHVDAEGFDWPITNSFLEIQTPNVVVFEKKHLTNFTLKKAKRRLSELKYVYWEKGQNLYSFRIGSSSSSI